MVWLIKVLLLLTPHMSCDRRHVIYINKYTVIKIDFGAQTSGFWVKVLCLFDQSTTHPTQPPGTSSIFIHHYLDFVAFYATHLTSSSTSIVSATATRGHRLTKNVRCLQSWPIRLGFFFLMKAACE